MLGVLVMLAFFAFLLPLNAHTKAFGVSDIVTLTNQARTVRNLPEYTPNALLMSAAQAKAETMAKEHFFAHIAPDGTTAWDYFKQVGYSYSAAGENLAITNENAETVTEGWLNSPTHRDNLLNTTYTDFGVGLANYGDYEGYKNTIVAVVFYGTPSASQALTATTNSAGGGTYLRPNLLPSSPWLIVIAAGTLISIGIFFEISLLKRLHHGQAHPNK